MKPKLIFFLSLVLNGLLPKAGQCAEESSAIKVKIDIPELWMNGKLVFQRTLQNRYQDAHFFVVIENVSSNLILFGDEDLDYNLSFEITDEDGEKTMIHHVAELDSGKLPCELRLAPGQVTVREIRYNLVKYGQQAEWEKFPFPNNPHVTDQTRKVTIRTVFEQKLPNNTPSPNFWTGKTLSDSYDVLLVDNVR